VSVSAHLTLRPDRCTLCDRCVKACPNGAVRVGQSYILIDWRACNQCCACVDACESQAIQREVVPLRAKATAAVAPGDVGKVVVGSRAEAKAVRKNAEKAAKQAAKAGMRPAGSGRVVSLASASGAGAAAAVAAAAGVPSLGQSAAASASEPPVSRVAKTKAAATQAATLGNLGTATWTLVDAAAVLAVLLLTIVGKNAVFAIPALALMPVAGRAAARAGVLAVYYSVQIAAFVFLAGRHGATFLAAFGLRRDADTDADARAAAKPGSVAGSIGLVLGLLVVVEVFAIGYGLTVQALGWKQPLSLSSDVAAVFGSGNTGFLLSALLIAFVAPFAEELAFRGVVLPALGERYGMWPSIVLSAVLFAAYHANLWLFFPMLVFGLALGWLTWSRRSLWPAISLHILYNGLAVIAAFAALK
jgi:membrane protease YdiL (CAAX protease family)/NAD-dependent dihydropyrimidine dehydrogenase PreA subunit